MKPRTFATIFGTKLLISQPGIISSIGLWIVLSLLAGWLLQLSASQAILAGFLAVLLHWFSEFSHHLGHAAAAQRTGYPIELIRMWYFLCLQKYPKDEPDLPAELHIRRALGGPAASLLLSLIGAVAVWALRPFGGLAYYLALFFALENFLVFFLGAFLPLGFTDGSTLLEWWPKRKHSA